MGAGKGSGSALIRWSPPWIVLSGTAADDKASVREGICPECGHPLKRLDHGDDPYCATDPECSCTYGWCDWCLEGWRARGLAIEVYGIGRIADELKR